MNRAYLDECLNRLKKRLSELDGGDGIAIAYSGGLDSRFLLHACKLAGIKALCLHFTGPHIRSDITDEALARLDRDGTPYRTALADPLTRQAVRNNRPDRCYHCKRLIFEELSRLAGNKALCDGSNKSDLTEYRPGRKALQELGIHSPLADCGIGKEEIRALGGIHKMDDPEQPSQSCLLTRFEYDMPLNESILRKIGGLERELELLLRANAVDTGQQPPLNFRLRVFKNGDNLEAPRLELHLESPDEPEADLAASLGKSVESHGFSRPIIRSVRKLSGYFDRVEKPA